MKPWAEGLQLWPTCLIEAQAMLGALLRGHLANRYKRPPTQTLSASRNYQLEVCRRCVDVRVKSPDSVTQPIEVEGTSREDSKGPFSESPTIRLKFGAGTSNDSAFYGQVAAIEDLRQQADLSGVIRRCSQ